MLDGSVTEYGYLVGRQSLPEFLGAVKRAAVGGEEMADERLTQEWRGVRAHIRALEKQEAGWADGPSREPLPSALLPRAESLLKNPGIQRDLRFFPYRCCVVELDRLVVYQNTVDWGFVQSLDARLPANPSEEEIFDFLMAEDPTTPPITVNRLSDNTFQFTSISSDLRYIDSSIIDPSRIDNLVLPGRPWTVIGVSVGYSLNFLTAIEARNRLVLGNRTHHAIVVRQRGITHVPCVVRTVATEEEFSVLPISVLAQHQAQFLTAPRPAVFKDYFDEDLCKKYQINRRRHLVEVQITVKQTKIPA